jgi:putative zinc finger protein
MERRHSARQGSEAMVIKCEDVWREISNYLDGEVDAELQLAIEEHVHECKRCAAVVAGTRNVIQLYADERMQGVPFGFSGRLHRRLESDRLPSRRKFLGWIVATGATALVVGGFEVASSSVSGRRIIRSQHARPSNRVPPDMQVIVAEEGKTFHVSGCPFIHAKAGLRTIPALEAEREGYVPCIRCMKKYLDATS